MKHICQLCIDVLTHAKNNRNKISETDFQEICGDDTDYVLAELKSKKIGFYIKRTKTIHSIKGEEIDKGLLYYKKILNN